MGGCRSGGGASSQEMALRAVCLASALSRCTCLSRVTLSGEAWSALGEGGGLAGPFLALASALQVRRSFV
jgi:hypothetical protein